MKLTKILILLIGLMALTAAASFAQTSAWFSFASKRNVATNAQTGEVDIVTLVSSFGDQVNPGIIPASRSIFYTFSQPISALGDIQVEMSLRQDHAAIDMPPGPMGLYETFYPISVYSGPNTGTQIAEIRVTHNGVDPSPKVVQIHFVAEVSVAQGDTITLGGVRVDTAGLGMVEGQEVYVSLSNPEGDIAIDNSENLPVARLHHPIYCEDCDDLISFRQDGRTYNDIATVTIGELFTNAFEPPEQIRIDISDIPAGFDFIGCAGLVGDDGDPLNTTEIEAGGALTLVSCSGVTDSVVIQINDSNESYFETVMVGLQFDLVGTPDFSQDPATLTIYKYPDVSACAYPWYSTGASVCAGSTPLKYAYMPIECYVYFDVDADIGGKLLSVFNVSDEVWDTGLAIMNGSGAEPLRNPYVWGNWWDIPQNGAVKVYMYPMYTYDGEDPFGYGGATDPAGGTQYSPYIFTTSATARPGLGLDEFGRVPNKGTWAVLASQLCGYAVLDEDNDGVVDAGETTLCSASWPSFEGFIIFETYFPSAEGVNFISDWIAMAHGYAMINLTRREMMDERLRDIYERVRRGGRRGFRP